MIDGLPVLDAHIHLDPSGRPKEAVQEFLAAGGSHLLVVHKPYAGIDVSTLEGYRKSFEATISMTALANKLGAKAWCVLGPYPGELPVLARTIGLEEAVHLQEEAVDLALCLVREGKAIGLGEVGRVHFPVEQEVMDGCVDVLRAALRGCSSLHVPAILHTESPSVNGGLMEHIALLSDEAGMDRKMVVKHYSGWELTDGNVNHGISVSMQCRRENLKRALPLGVHFLLETDYIDDPERRNVVMPPDTVPKRIRWALGTGLLSNGYLEMLMVEVPRRVLGIETMA